MNTYDAHACEKKLRDALTQERRAWHRHGGNSRAWWQAAERVRLWEGRLEQLGWKASDFHAFTERMEQREQLLKAERAARAKGVAP